MLTAIYLSVAEAAQEAWLAFAEGRLPTILGYPIAKRCFTLAGEMDLPAGDAHQFATVADDNGFADPQKSSLPSLQGATRTIRIFS